MTKHSRPHALAAAAIFAALALPAFGQGQAPSAAPPSGTTVTPLSRNVFENVQLHRPAGEVQQFVVFFTAAGQRSAQEQRMLQTMLARQSMVATVPFAALYRNMAGQSQRDQCVIAPGAVEDFARYAQAYQKLPVYIPPLLVGSGDAGGFVYTTLAQSGTRAFTGGLSQDFCPRLSLPVMPMCAVGGLKSAAADLVGSASTRSSTQLLQPAGALRSPWTAQATEPQSACAGAGQSFVQQVPGATWRTAEDPAGFDAAFAALAAQRPPLVTAPADIADIPVTEVPVTGNGGGNGQRFAILVSGDGGWASIDKQIAAALQRQGVPVVGIDSLRYFWTARTPEGVARDLDRVLRHYAARWQRSEAILIGYSQGADVLPFALNRLPAATRQQVRLNVLIAPGQKAAFEFHVSNWIGKSGDRPIAPEARRLQAADTLCVYGTDEKADSLCPELAPAHAQPIATSGGHHLDGNYEGLVARILGAVPAR